MKATPMLDHRWFLENAADAIFAVDTEGRYFYSNPAHQRLVGYSEDEILGSHSTLLLDEETVEYIEAIIDELLETDGKHHGTFELDVHTKDGRRIPVETAFSLLIGEHGDYLGTLGVTREIAERKQREQKLEEYERLIEASGDGVYATNAEGYYTYLNEAGAEILGLDREDILGRHVSKVLDEEDLERANQLVRELLKDDERDHDTLPLTFTHNGDPTITESHVALLRDESGEYRGTVGVVRDVTERKQRQRRLEAYETAVESTQDGIAVMALEGVAGNLTAEDLKNRDYRARYLVVNRAWAVPIGYEPEELIGTTTSLWDAPSHEDGAQESVANDILRKLEAADDGDNIQVKNQRTIDSPEYGEMEVEFQTTLVQRDVETPLLVTFARDITQHVKHQQELERYGRIVKTLGDGIFALDAEGRVLEANQAMLDLLGRDRESVVGQVGRKFYDEDMVNTYKEAVRRLLKHEDEDLYRLETTLHSATGEAIPIEVTLTLLPRGENGEFRGTAGAVRDMTVHKQREEERQRFETLLETMPDTVVVTDTDSIITEIHGFEEEETGWAREELIGEHVSKAMAEEDVESVEALSEQLLEGDKDKITIEVDVLTKDGQTIPCESHVALLPPDENGEIPGGISVLRDITEQKQLQEKLRRQALYDDLTGLPNRAGFVDRLRSAFEEYRDDNDALFAVLYLDLDRFKKINESMGHPMGDALLKAVGSRMENLVGPSDTVARVGGDEFALLVRDVEDPDDARAWADRVTEALQQPFTLEGQNLFTRASLGIVLPSSGNYKEADALLRDVEIACTRSKNTDRSYVLFDPEMHEATQEEMALEMDLQRSIDRGELEAHYQPIIRIEDESLLGFEALIRWNHPERGYLSPGVFLPVARKIGFMSTIDYWILKQACRDILAWRDHPACPDDVFVSVNSSAIQFSDPEYAENVLEILDETNMDPSALYLEITEDAVVANPELAAELIGRLQQEGVHFAVDDFGTGYSSLDHLSTLPIDMLKIDRSFIFQLDSKNGDEKNRSIVRAIMNLADGLHTDVIAEGIEEEHQIDTLLDLDCHLGQGFYYAKPMNADDVMEFLQSRERSGEDRRMPSQSSH